MACGHLVKQGQVLQKKQQKKTKLNQKHLTNENRLRCLEKEKKKRCMLHIRAERKLHFSGASLLLLPGKLRCSLAILQASTKAW